MKNYVKNFFTVNGWKGETLMAKSAKIRGQLLIMKGGGH
jgi:hypothetical protein